MKSIKIRTKTNTKTVTLGLWYHYAKFETFIFFLLITKWGEREELKETGLEIFVKVVTHVSLDRHIPLDTGRKLNVHKTFNVICKLNLCRLYMGIVQSNMSIADMLCSGHLVIADMLLWNRSNHGQTLI